MINDVLQYSTNLKFEITILIRTVVISAEIQPQKHLITSVLILLAVKNKSSRHIINVKERPMVSSVGTVTADDSKR